jgi:hypothetical protein
MAFQNTSSQNTAFQLGPPSNVNVLLEGVAATGGVGTFTPTVLATTSNFTGVRSDAVSGDFVRKNVLVLNRATNPGDITLSSDGLTATSATAAFGSITASGSRSGKLCFKATINSNPGGLNQMGFTSTTWTYGAGAFLGGGGSVGLITNGEIWHSGASQLSTGFGFANGDFFLCVIDTIARKVWFQKNGTGNWNNQVGHDPATGVGGVSLPFGGQVYAAVGFRNNGASMTIDADPTGTPSGFTNFDDFTTVGEPLVEKALDGVSSAAGVGSFEGGTAKVVSKDLAGVAATGSPGTFVPTVLATTSNFVGVSSAASAGTFTPVVLKSLTGVAATSGIGSITPLVVPNLSGVAATGSPGTFGIVVTKDNTGVAATSGVGTFGGLGKVVSKDLVGVSALSGVGTIAAVPVPTMVGVVATGNAGTFGFSFVVDSSGRIVYVAPEFREVSSDPDDLLDDDSVAPVGISAGSEDRVVYVEGEDRTVQVQ